MSRLLEALPNGGPNAVITSGEYSIDSEGKVIDVFGVPGPPILLSDDRVPSLDAVAGGPVYRVAGKELLRRCLLMMQNPFYFATTCYPRTIYDALGGYTVRRLYNPDKWFNWRMLELVDEAYYVDLPLFSYRWHTSNQLSQQKGSGALKYLVDEYLSTVEISNEMLAAVGLSRADVERAFVEYDIGRHGLAELAKEQRGRRPANSQLWPRRLSGARPAKSQGAGVAAGGALRSAGTNVGRALYRPPRFAAAQRAADSGARPAADRERPSASTGGKA